jgi:type VI secretion system FHA domain protein
MESEIGHSLDLDSLLTPRDPGESGSISMRNAFGLKVSQDARASLLEVLQKSVATLSDGPAALGNGAEPAGRADSVVPGSMGAAPAPAPAAAPAKKPAADNAAPDWAVRTRAISREELADALARRQSRVEASKRTVQLHQQASTWADLRSAVQAFCRGAGIDPASLTPEAQAMMPLVAGQLLREAIVGLNDIAQARTAGSIGAKVAATPAAPSGSSNPLRTSKSVEQAIQRLFESHGRLYAGPVDSLRDVLQETKDHEAALVAAMRAGLDAVLEQLSPTNVADQFEQGRARMLAPGQDPRPKYWEHYADFYQLLKQQAGTDELPHPFVEAFGQEYARVRTDLRNKRGA